ncbi:MAG: metallophosphoesterase [Tepidisphaeraceae bacterium]
MRSRRIRLAQATVPVRQAVGRIAHLTDVHVQPERGGEAGFVACLHHVQTHAKPDLVLFGGDGVFDVVDRDAARRDELAAMWRRVLKNELSTPHRSAIGNHDVWDLKALGAARADEDQAKAWPCDLYGLNRRYYSFDQFGWHIVVLDDVRLGGPHGYAGAIDEAQLAWLRADLAAAAPKPVLVLSHIPIVTVIGFFDGERTKTGDWDVPRSYMHIDANSLHELLVAAGNVKLCISGHEHQLDRCWLDGITYGCHGAVCGNWWQGTYHHTPAGYATIDLFDDGTFEIGYHDFGWQARE